MIDEKHFETEWYSGEAYASHMMKDGKEIDLVALQNEYKARVEKCGKAYAMAWLKAASRYIADHLEVVDSETTTFRRY